MKMAHRIFGDLSDEQILADIPSHKRAMMRPLLKTPEFCATCHKASSTPALNGYKQLPGFSAYDEWQQSGASQESLTPFYRREARFECRTCHMPKVPSSNDRAAKDGLIAWHRWLGANTAAPLFYGQLDQVKLIESFLKGSVLNVDIFALKREATGEVIMPLIAGAESPIPLQPGEEVIAEVVVSNRNAAHSFPPEVRDLYETWVEFEAIDASGKMIFHSGFLKPDGLLDESAHIYKTILLDEAGRPITRHQIWLTRIKAYDNTLHAGRSEVARFQFHLPNGTSASPVILRARVNYRRLNQEYIDYVLKRQQKTLAIPVVRMAEAETKVQMLEPGTKPPDPGPQSALAQARRWNDYGIGLLEQAQYGAAAQAFRQASTLDPRDPNLLVNAAIAELRTERFAPERTQLQKAAALLVQALALEPAHARARFYRALVWRGEGKLREAADELTALTRQYPRDREVQRQLGQTLYTLGHLAEARVALEAVLAIDPNDAGVYRLLAPIYASEGRQAEAEGASTLYLQWRDDPEAAPVAARFFAAHPEWQDERIGAHAHSRTSPSRPVLTGASAAPDQ
jgi:Flp pilus assembly protein TadD